MAIDVAVDVRHGQHDKYKETAPLVEEYKEAEQATQWATRAETALQRERQHNAAKLAAKDAEIKRLRAMLIAAGAAPPALLT